jgi:hypothetical protein
MITQCDCGCAWIVVISGDLIQILICPKHNYIRDPPNYYGRLRLKTK